MATSISSWSTPASRSSSDPKTAVIGEDTTPSRATTNPANTSGLEPTRNGDRLAGRAPPSRPARTPLRRSRGSAISAKSRLPSSVGTTPSRRRTNKGVPAAASSERMWLVAAG